jgi:hypothetical protein
MRGDVAVATMIPNLDPRMIENDGERRVYGALKGLPGDHTVLYSYKYQTIWPVTGDPDFGEADFIVVHTALGYLVIEVKQGKTGYRNGQWYEDKGTQRPLSKDSV